MANTAKIPVVDISDERNQQEVARELVDAAIKHGFVYIKNTGKDIPVEAIDEAFEIVCYDKECYFPVISKLTVDSV
jgi:Isopenicillin N synthase and related dioxygenases